MLFASLFSLFFFSSLLPSLYLILFSPLFVYLLNISLLSNFYSSYLRNITFYFSKITKTDKN